MKFGNVLGIQLAVVAAALGVAQPEAMACRPSFSGCRVASCDQCGGGDVCVGGSDGLFCFFGAARAPSDDGTRDTTQALEGDFVFHVDFGAGQMNDRLHLEAATDGQLQGTYEVPGVFESPVSSVTVQGLTAIFTITAHENGTSYEVRYELGRDPATGVISGNVFSGGQRIGSARLERVN